MKEDIDRYKRLMEEWRGASGTPKEEPKPDPKAVSRPVPSGPGSDPADRRLKLAPVPPQGRHPRGTLLCINDEELVVYDKGPDASGRDSVLDLLYNGAVKPIHMNLTHSKTVRMGCLTPEAFNALCLRMRWDRAGIAAACDSADDAARIPDPVVSPVRTPEPQPPHPRDDQRLPRAAAPEDPPPAQPAPRDPSAVPPGGKPQLRRGVKLQLKFGGKLWEAVYWGRDQSGTVVAHRTNRSWELMHLDLDNFKDSLVVSPAPDRDLLEQINRDLQTKYEGA